MRVPAHSLPAMQARTTPRGSLPTPHQASAAPASSVRLSGPADATLAGQAEIGRTGVRPDVVARIRAELAAGTIGTAADLAATVDALLLELA